MHFHLTKAYKYRPILDSTLVSRIISQTAELFGYLQKIKSAENEYHFSSDKRKPVFELRRYMILALKNLKEIAIDSETILYREMLEISEIDSRLDKIKKNLEQNKKISSELEKQQIEQQERSLEEYIKEFNEMKYTIREVLKKLAKSAENILTGRLSHIRLREVSLRNDNRIIALMKRRGIEVFSQLKKIDELSKDISLLKLPDIEKRYKTEFNDIELIVEFAYILIQRFKHMIASIKTDDEKIKKELDKTLQYFHEVMKIIDKNMRLGLHEINRLAA